MRLLPVLLIAAVSAARCGDTIIQNILPTNPTDTTPKVVVNTFQYRVGGNASSVRIRYSNEKDGLIQSTTTLPFFTSFSSTASSVFLSLDVTPISYPTGTVAPFVSAQIFVNGDLFREASSNDLTLQTVSVNGTWRLTPTATKGVR